MTVGSLQSDNQNTTDESKNQSNDHNEQVIDLLCRNGAIA